MRAQSFSQGFGSLGAVPGIDGDSLGAGKVETGLVYMDTK